MLVSHITHQTKSWLAAHLDHPLLSNQEVLLEALLERLLAGTPLAYLIGHWEFFGMDFFINESVLVPRPETELLVEKAISWLKENPSARSIAEAGTGSGCISIILAKVFPNTNIIATDISHMAMQIAQRNIAQFSIGNITLVECDLLVPIESRFDLICANLPYIPTGKLTSLSVNKFEPRLALDGGKDGLYFIQRLIEMATTRLAPKGVLLLEIESSKKVEILALSRQFFPHASIHVFEDHAKKPRLLVIQTQ